MLNGAALAWPYTSGKANGERSRGCHARHPSTFHRSAQELQRWPAECSRHDSAIRIQQHSRGLDRRRAKKVVASSIVLAPIHRCCWRDSPASPKSRTPAWLSASAVTTPTLKNSTQVTRSANCGRRNMPVRRTLGRFAEKPAGFRPCSGDDLLRPC